MRLKKSRSVVVYLLIHLQRTSEIDGSFCPYIPPPHISSKLEGKRGLDMTPPRSYCVLYNAGASNNNARCFKDPSLSNHLIFLRFAAAAARFLGDKLVLGRRFPPGFLVEAKKTYASSILKKRVGSYRTRTDK